MGELRESVHQLKVEMEVDKRTYASQDCKLAAFCSVDCQRLSWP
eukprot:gene24627-46269_t